MLSYMAETKNTEVSLVQMDTTGDANFPEQATVGADVHNNGEMVFVHDNHTTTGGRARSAIYNEGNRDLELVSFIGGISEGSENGRYYFEVGYRAVGNAAVENHVLNKFGAGGVTGGYTRDSNVFYWQEGARPRLNSGDELYFVSNGDTAGTGDTTKAFMSFTFKTVDSGSGGNRL